MDVLGLRYFSCDRCELVHSALDEPVCCARCNGGDLTPIVADRGRDGVAAGAAYFAGSMDNGD